MLDIASHLTWTALAVVAHFASAHSTVQTIKNSSTLQGEYGDFFCFVLYAFCWGSLIYCIYNNFHLMQYLLPH